LWVMVLLAAGVLRAGPVWIPGQSLLPIDPGCNPFTVQVLEHDASGVTVEVQFAGLALSGEESGYVALGDGYHQIEPDTVPGLPRWSTWIDLGAYDAGAVTVMEEERRVVEGYHLAKKYPGQDPLLSTWFPVDKVRLGDPVVLRDIRMAPLTVFPVRARADGDELEVTSRMVVRIDRIPGQGDNAKCAPDRPIPRGFAKLYRQMLLVPLDESREIIGDHLLIITPDYLADYLDPMIEWKREKGIKVTRTLFSDIGANPSNASIIYNFLEEVYETWLDVPDYVLFVGDETEFPTHDTYTQDPYTMFSYYSYPGYFLNDNWFVCQDGNDYFPEFFQGRWVINTQNEADLLTTKVLLHERDLHWADSTWYEKAVVAADYTEPTMQTTKTWVKNRLLEHGFIRVDSVYSGGSTLFASYVNNGRNYVNYRGAGWNYGWTGIPFYVSNVEGLYNYFKLPIVTGIGCGVAKFDVSDDDCFGERWMTLGSVSQPRGAAGFIGPTWNTHTYYNDALDKGIYMALLDSNDLELSPMLLSGKMHMYDQFEPYFSQDPDIIEIVKSAFNQFINLSDPQLDLFSAKPWRPTITHPDFVMLGTHSYDVSVWDESGLPVEGVRVCMYFDSAYYAVGATDDQGEVSLELTVPTVEDSVTVTVTGMNVFPTQVMIPTNPSAVLLLHHSMVIDDGAQGNGDGRFNPGEQVQVHEVLRNDGTATAMEIDGILSTLEPEVTISQDYAEYGNISPEDTAGSVPDYALSLSTNYNIGQVLEFTMTLSDTGSEPWDIEITIPVSTPDLRFVSASADEQHNGRWDPGETVDLSVEMTNAGLQSLPETPVVFRTDNPYVIVHDSIAMLPASNPGDTVEMADDLFLVESSEQTPQEAVVEFTINLEYQFSTYNFQQSARCSIVVGLVTAACPTWDDSLYFAYDNGDTNYTECPTFGWIEIAPDAGGPGDTLAFTQSDQTIPVPLPFPFQYYGEVYNHVSVSTDGWLAVGEVTLTNYSNSTLPCQLDHIQAMVAPFWDDLWHQNNEDGQICTYHNQDEGLFVVEYYQVGHFSSASQEETFEVVFYDPAVYQTVTGDGEILFQFQEITTNGILRSTTGIESPSERVAIEYNYEGSHPISAYDLANGMAIKFTPDTVVVITDVGEPAQKLSLVPGEYVLDQNYPNPFNPVTTIRYGIPQPGDVKLVLYNILGQKVVMLADAVREAGYHQVVWDGRDRNGVPCAAGVYFYRLEANDFVSTKKMVLLK
jgi:hypothetical protein